jgi:hypothetical protein
VEHDKEGQSQHKYVQTGEGQASRIGLDKDKSSPEAAPKTGVTPTKLLMIHQLWLWQLDESTCTYQDPFKSPDSSVPQLTGTKAPLSPHFQKDGTLDLRTTS